MVLEVHRDFNKSKHKIKVPLLFYGRYKNNSLVQYQNYYIDNNNLNLTRTTDKEFARSNFTLVL